ncbi:hypothetical protein BDF14DRAFT_1847529 [Spinellus fusiger]|nr:hypothetical protein BDF14DRAFT_1847529 [Spinellus fusiger]
MLGILLVITTVFALIQAQANTKNPFAWQMMVRYDIGKSNITQSYMTETSEKMYSLDFQTVYSLNDYYGHNERLLIDMGDACANTTLMELDARNGNTTTGPSMMSQPSIGLIRRGGGCSSWSEKINTVQALSQAYRLRVSAVILYDNTSYNDTLIVSESTTNKSFPIWNSSVLPPERNISFMPENDVDLQTTFVAVYFVPFVYGSQLLEKIKQTFTIVNNQQQHLQLTMFLRETSFSPEEGAGDTNSRTNYPSDNDTTQDDVWSLFSGDRKYVAYLVVSIAVIVIGVFFIKCSLSIRSRYAARGIVDTYSRQPVQQTIYLSPTGNLIVYKKKLKKESLDRVCPVQVFSENNDKANLDTSTCCICIEDFTQDRKLRVLPCSHAFCVDCIDGWLLVRSIYCPICKFDCSKVIETEKTEHFPRNRHSGPVTTNYSLSSPMTIATAAAAAAAAAADTIASPSPTAATNDTTDDFILPPINIALGRLTIGHTSLETPAEINQPLSPTTTITPKKDTHPTEQQTTLESIPANLSVTMPSSSNMATNSNVSNP